MFSKFDYSFFGIPSLATLITMTIVFVSLTKTNKIQLRRLNKMNKLYNRKRSQADFLKAIPNGVILFTENNRTPVFNDSIMDMFKTNNENKVLFNLRQLEIVD
jgi:c-di-AMP phosphodiesterase-like protein|mmetsp:Transcript_14179/g.2271  ORF Transcript_14179/g.2271 Transcript_14179/m.2271 type:complete len:103 (-) Transcript_14179:1376-1684(-)